MRFLTAAGILVIMLALALPACADSLAVPGVRLNGAYMDMLYEVVMKGWGPPDAKDELADGLTVYRHKRYLTLFGVMEGKVALAETFSGSFSTDKGIKTGSHRTDVEKAYGSPIDQENYTFTYFDGSGLPLYSLIYKGDGIGFSFDPQTHRVRSLFVFPAGVYPKLIHQ
ncbi:MAG: hypothetical protein RDV48_08590 [Candidatus Eremiobacteraeota bacterium]|nr:hypothetical protein [Candidatus Eremiobacteraeota bacterium]